MSQRLGTATLSRVAPIALALALAVALAACQSAPAPEVLGKAPDFRLTDQDGGAFASSDLIGHAALFDFIYTHCTDACPMLTSNLAQVQKKLKNDGLLGSKVTLVSLSVDPQHDTPGVLREYAAQYGADTQSWRFLTGSWDDVFSVVADFKVGVKTPAPPADAPVPGGNEITHTTRLVLVDPQGQVRGYPEGGEQSPDQLVAAVKAVLPR